MRREPFVLRNPVLRRELALFTRRGVFEWVVLVLTVALTLVIASLGGQAGVRAHPAEIGRVLFQTFFGLAHALVLVAGPAVAASSIASEREGRTFEALALTGLGAARIARGKFLAALAGVGAYVVALAPVGALPFLFGGVSALATLYAFAMLFVVAALAALTGLAISVRAAATRTALIASVLAGGAIACALYALAGEALGDVACRAVGFARPGTIWLPVVLAEGDLTAAEFALLAGAPTLAAGFVGWFLYEVCVANLQDASADRSSGLKRGYVATVLAGTPLACLFVASAGGPLEHADAAIAGLAAYAGLALLAAIVFQGEPLAPPRRVWLRWRARGAGVVRRALGPGLLAAAALQITGTCVVVAALSAAGLRGTLVGDEGVATTAALGVVAAAMSLGTSAFFAAALATWLRARLGVGASRTALAITVLVLAIAPFTLAAILPAMRGDALAAVGSTPWILAPSPAFAVVVARHVARDVATARELLAVFVAAVAQFALGIAALVAAARRIERTVAAVDADAARVDAVIAREDAAATAAQPGAT